MASHEFNTSFLEGKISLPPPPGVLPLFFCSSFYVYKYSEKEPGVHTPAHCFLWQKYCGKADAHSTAQPWQALQEEHRLSLPTGSLRQEGQKQSAGRRCCAAPGINKMKALTAALLQALVFPRVVLVSTIQGCVGLLVMIKTPHGSRCFSFPLKDAQRVEDSKFPRSGTLHARAAQ